MSAGIAGGASFSDSSMLSVSSLSRTSIDGFDGVAGRGELGPGVALAVIERRLKAEAIVSKPLPMLDELVVGVIAWLVATAGGAAAAAVIGSDLTGVAGRSSSSCGSLLSLPCFPGSCVALAGELSRFSSASTRFGGSGGVDLDGVGGASPLNAVSGLNGSKSSNCAATALMLGFASRAGDDGTSAQTLAVTDDGNEETSSCESLPSPLDMACWQGRRAEKMGRAIAL